MHIYFDNAATTEPCFCQKNTWGNPSSPHQPGIAAERELNAAREEMAKTLACTPSEVVFTSGGTESNNLAIIGLALANKRRGITFLAQPFEHPAILEPLKFIQSQSWGGVCISPSNQWQQIADNNTGTLVVATSHIHHETGDIAPLQEIRKNYPNAIIVTDGAQGFCKEEIPKEADIYTFSSHKIHAPAGCGGMKIKRGLRLVPLMYGGGQENKLRPGTENLQGILCMAKASYELSANRLVNHAHVTEIKNILLSISKANHLEQTSPYILNQSFPGIKGEVLVNALGRKCLYVSTGAACSTKKSNSTTLEKMGFPQQIADSAIRLSFSHKNTVEEALMAKKIIEETVVELKTLLAKGT